ncbi:thiamine pyrophosphate-dependent enzyme [Scopulibacillus darangshiensis]|nr:thiamine pyrophosphate-dependent enzyme [Scopulibacillus darangshiensis]
MLEEMTGAEALVRCLEIEEAERVFCVPGESYLPVLDGFYNHPSIKLIAGRHEGGASFMAEGYAKASGKPGIVFATRGVGASNLTIGVHTAFQDSTPMVVFLGQVHSKFRGREGFQEVDLDRFFSPIAKWAVEINHADRMAEMVQRAFNVAQSGRPGPVVVSLPEDVLKETGKMAFGGAYIRSKPLADPDQVKQASEMLARADRPVIIAGGGVKLSAAEDMLKTMAEKCDIPVLASFRRHDVFPNDHGHYCGHLGLGTPKPVLDTIRKADVILAVGTKLSEVTTQDYGLITPEHQLIHIDIHEETVGKIYHPNIGIIADANHALRQLCEAGEINKRADRSEWVSACRKTYESAAILGLAIEEDHKEGCNLKNIIKTMQNVLPRDAIITNDAGNFAGWLHAFYQFTKPGTYIGPTSGAMGYGMPAALGAKVAYPDRIVVSLSGDGGFMMTMQELETAARYNIPIIALVFNNAMYGTIRMHQEKHYPERVVGTSLGRVHFTDVAKGLNIDSYSIGNSKEFDELLKQLLTHPLNAPILIEIPMDPEQISVKSTIEAFRSQA